MILQTPYWLILGFPLGVLLVTRSWSSRLLTVLRGTMLSLILMALCGPQIKLPSHRGTVVIVADRSQSMPVDATAAHIETIKLIQAHMAPQDRLGIVAYGKKAIIEQPPRQPGFQNFIYHVDPEGSNLAAALDLALTMIPKDWPGRILLLSDGRWTGRDPQTAALSALARGTAIDFRFYQPPDSPSTTAKVVNDVVIRSLQVPDSVTPGESYLIKADLTIPSHQQLKYTLYRNQTLIASGQSYFSETHPRLLFRDRSPKSDIVEYRLEVNGFGQDPVPQNNHARTILEVRGKRSVLWVGKNPQSGLGRILTQNGIQLQYRSPETAHWQLTKLAKYAAVILENVPAAQIGHQGLITIAQWVQMTGAGLVVTGGTKAYGVGGYFRSPLETILPVSMELRSEHRKLSLAMAVVLDRSGSMAMIANGGRTKMDLANIGTAQVLDMLSPFDEFGVIAVDSRAHIIVDLAQVENIPAARNRILHTGAAGGGIFVYSGLLAAADMLQHASAGTKHILLFADAADAEEPGRYKDLMAKCRAAGITVSVVGLGTASDSDAAFLQDIAQRGQGQCLFTNTPEEIPRIFAQDTFSVMRGAFIEEATDLNSTAALLPVYGTIWDQLPQIQGYNLCYARPGANISIISDDEYQAPILSYWQAGNGRVICYTGEADGKHTGSLAQWEKVGELFSGMTRWAAGDRQNLPPEIQLVRRITKGVLHVECHLDPERKTDLIQEAPQVTLLRENTQKEYSTTTTPLEWISPDILATEIPMDSDDTIVPVVSIQGFQPVSLPPVCLPYSPEFKPADNLQAYTALQSLSYLTGGQERFNLKNIWKDLPIRPRFLDMTPEVIIMAMLLFLYEIYCRRTGKQTLPLSWPLLSQGNISKWVKLGSRTKNAPQPQRPQRKPPPQNQVGEPIPPRRTHYLSALKQAKQKARKRLDGKPS